MGLESATYISELVGTNPTGADDKNQGDNHLRLIKGVLQSQFPNLGAEAVTATAAELSGFVPTGCIIMWSGTSGTIPTGWVLCNGSNSTPNLTSKFVRGGTASGATGGNNQIQLASTDSHSLTVAQLPAHTHGIPSAGGTADQPTGTYSRTDDGGLQKTNNTNSTGGGTGHSHTLNFDSTSNLPAYYTLVYIMKT
jgi:microcystin-dependent protein